MYRVLTLLSLLSHTQSVTFANTDATLAPHLYYHPLKISDNATVVTTQYGPNLHMPIDIIQLIIIYKTGGIVYNYSQRFEEFTNNTVYITPIIFGYIETLLFLSMCIVSKSEHNIIILSSVYICILSIHGLCALISYHKCKKYEIIIRNFKQSLYANHSFIEYVLQIDSESDTIKNKNNSNMNCEHWHWSVTVNKHRLLSTILNPTNNTLAYIAYQRWINVKCLEFENDYFTRSKSALYLSVSKYFLPSYYILSILLLLFTPVTVSIIWGVIFVHSLYVLLYSYFRVIENMSHSLSLRRCLMFGVFQDTMFLGSALYFVINPLPLHSNDSAKYDKMEIKSKFAPFGGGAFGIFLFVIFGVFGLFYVSILVVMICKIMKCNHHFVTTLDANGAYRFWLYCFIICWIVMIDAQFEFVSMFFIPSFKNLLMVIAGYMVTQQVIHRIMSGIEKYDYIKRFITHNPREWLKNELKLLFVPYIR